MNINKLTRYDVFTAEIARFNAVDKLFNENHEGIMSLEVSNDIYKAMEENSETEREIEKRYGI